MPRKVQVYIVESPSPYDLYEKRFEGESLQKTLRLSGVDSCHHLVVSKQTFESAFTSGIVECVKANPSFPIVHISAHGNKGGIMLTDNTYISWQHLKNLLLPIHQALESTGSGLLICMSTCEGFSGCQMAMEDDNFPYLAILGNTKTPNWAETNIAFATFYHLFCSLGTDPFKAVEAMRIASGNDYFLLDYSISARKAYLEYQKKNAELISTAISQEIQKNKSKK